MIDTGAPRNVTGHVVSGAIASAAIAGGMQYSQLKQGKVSQKEAIATTVKLSLQGGIATGAAIAAANHLGRGSIFGVLGALSIGIAGVYAVEKVSEAVRQQTQEEAAPECETK